jgi:hypothetical protein
MGCIRSTPSILFDLEGLSKILKAKPRYNGFQLPI